MPCTTQHLKDKPESVPVHQHDAPVLIPLALTEEVEHYGVGVMMPSAVADSRKSHALGRMAQVFTDLEPDADLLSLAVSFFDEERSDFQDLPLGQRTASTTLNGRELEAVQWRTTSAQGSAMGSMLIIQKP